MKNAFAVSSLILTVGYSVAVAAEMIGVVLFRMPNFPEFIGVYTAIGILTFAFGNYFRQPSSRIDSGRASATKNYSLLRTPSLINATLQAK